MSEEIIQVRQYSKTNKIIKDLKERNDKLNEQYRLRDIRCVVLEKENERLQQKVEQLENIRKEIIEYIEKDKLNIDESQCYVETQNGWKMIPEIYDDLLNILNKGSEDK